MNPARGNRLVILLFGLGLVFCTPRALAHSRPKVMVPAPDSTVSSPATISVTFTEPLEPRFSSLSVIDEQGKKYNAAASLPAQNDPKTLTLSLPALKPGDYLVHWVTVAPDGHRMEGEYKFTVKP